MKKNYTILAIESSCDETSAAVVKNGEELSNVISSQEIHTRYGGVIPELASRAHLQSISRIVQQAMEIAGISFHDLNAIAVTTQPGLAGALLVGSSFAKGLALKLDLPIVPVHHIEGHLFSGMLENPDVQFPFVALVVSGGHTSIFHVESYDRFTILGNTKDDAAGEAFDKIAKMLGLSYPGGPIIDALAKQGNPSRYEFPRSMLHDGTYQFSFSGLKTSVRNFLQKEFPNGIPNEETLHDICASVQSAIVEVLTKKTINAAKALSVKTIVIAGGVSANSGLRSAFLEYGKKRGLNIVLPRMSYCMDNAAMIGFLAEQKLHYHGEDAYRSFQFTVNSKPLRAISKKD